MPQTRGFTLVELMVVVSIIALLAVVALPSMGRAAVDRHVYEDAGRITDLVRGARARAMGRGAAVLVTMNTSTGAGLYTASESVTDNTFGSGKDGTARVPRSTCMSPTNWALPKYVNEYERVDLTGGYETTNGIHAFAWARPTGAVADKGADPQTLVNLCFTPMGRVYRTVGAAPTQGMFDGVPAVSDTVVVDVARLESGKLIGIARRAIVPSSGLARVTSAPSLFTP